MDPTPTAKNRFLAFRHESVGRPVAIRVTFADLLAPFDAYDGTAMWVSEPQRVTENAGKVSPNDAPAWATFWAATLQCQPEYRDWSTYGIVNVYHELLVPGSGGLTLMSGLASLRPVSLRSGTRISDSAGSNWVSGPARLSSLALDKKGLSADCPRMNNRYPCSGSQRTFLIGR